MTYRLAIDTVVGAVYDSLPAPAADAFTLALAAVCEDPYGTTEPYGEDDHVVRMLMAGDVMAVLLVTDAMKLVRVLQINYLG